VLRPHGHSGRAHATIRCVTPKKRATDASPWVLSAPAPSEMFRAWSRARPAGAHGSRYAAPAIYRANRPHRVQRSVTCDFGGGGTRLGSRSIGPEQDGQLSGDPVRSLAMRCSAWAGLYVFGRGLRMNVYASKCALRRERCAPGRVKFNLYPAPDLTRSAPGERRPLPPSAGLCVTYTARNARRSEPANSGVRDRSPGEQIDRQ
jgi:hypothetical protein